MFEAPYTKEHIARAITEYPGPCLGESPGNFHLIKSDMMHTFNILPLDFVLQLDLLALRSVLHQQSICSSLPGGCSCSSSHKTLWQGQKEKLND